MSQLAFYATTERSERSGSAVAKSIALFASQTPITLLISAIQGDELDKKMLMMQVFIHHATKLHQPDSSHS